MSWCAPVSEMPNERPCVVLSLLPPLGRDIAELIGTGCEEENIPLAWDMAQDAEETAHAVAMRSRLDVGILAKDGEAAIGVTQVPEGAWMELKIKRSEDWRWLGQVAARLVKGQPMPPKPGDLRARLKPKAQPVPKIEPAPLPVVDVGLHPVTTPYEEERKLAGDFEALVSRVTQEIISQMRRGGEVVG